MGTPGRLWDLISESEEGHLAAGVRDVRYLAIDETDRMVEKGHFEELQQLLEMINADQDKMAARQNFVFSATLSMVHDIPGRFGYKIKNHKSVHDETLKRESQEVFFCEYLFCTRIIYILPQFTFMFRNYKTTLENSNEERAIFYTNLFSRLQTI